MWARLSANRAGVLDGRHHQSERIDLGRPYKSVEIAWWRLACDRKQEPLGPAVYSSLYKGGLMQVTPFLADTNKVQLCQYCEIVGVTVTITDVIYSSAAARERECVYLLQRFLFLFSSAT